MASEVDVAQLEVDELGGGEELCKVDLSRGGGGGGGDG